MVSYLQVEGLTKSVGDRILFADVTFGIFEGDKVGLIARNGNGKTTLLNIIAGRDTADSGNVVFRNGLRTGYLDQHPTLDPNLTVLENVTKRVDTTEKGIQEKAIRMLDMLKITDMSQLAGTLSGGQLKRVALVAALLNDPDFLILDEPTNHLNIEIIEWLENYLSHKRVTLLMVTHDRYFLDNVCNSIIEIDDEQIYTYKGNYNYYLHKREERIENASNELTKIKNLLRTEREWMSRQPQARGSKAKYRIDNFHELERKSQTDPAERQLDLNIKGSYIGSKIFEAHSISKSFGDKVIIRDWTYTFARYDKVGIVGDNGVGKSTFIKMLIGQVSTDSGHFDIGETVRWGYYSQEGIKFNDNMKVIDAVRAIAEEIVINDKTRMTASQFLNLFLFPVKTQQNYIAKLSGGERRRLYLATVLMANPNFLVLDEPTNDLDIVTLSVLENYLASFKGCVIIVSHDRFFLDRTVNHLFVFKGNGIIKDFPGDYSTYRHCVEQEKLELKATAKTDATVEAGQRKKPRLNAPVAKLTYKETKEKEELETLLPTLENEKAELEAKMSSGKMTTDELMEASSRIAYLIDKIDETEMRLLELMEKDPR